MTASALANAGLVTCLVFNALFVAGFLARSRWRSPDGIFILALTAVLELLLGMRLYGRLTVPLPDVFWAVAYWALAVTFGFLLYGLWVSHGRPWLGGMTGRIRRVRRRDKSKES